MRQNKNQLRFHQHPNQSVPEFETVEIVRVRFFRIVHARYANLEHAARVRHSPTTREAACRLKEEEATRKRLLGDDGDDSLNGQSGTDIINPGEGGDTVIDPPAEINASFVLSAALLTALEKC